jgi:hypothetical protein
MAVSSFGHNNTYFYVARKVDLKSKYTPRLEIFIEDGFRIVI